MQSGSKSFLITLNSCNIYLENKIEFTPEVVYSIAFSLLQNQTIQDCPPYFPGYLSLQADGSTLSPLNKEEFWITSRRYSYAIKLFEIVASDKNNAEVLATSAKFILNTLEGFYAQLAKDVSLTPDLNKAIEKVALAKLRCKCLKTNKLAKQIMAKDRYLKAMDELKVEIILAARALNNSIQPKEENKKEESPRKALGKLNLNKCNFWFVPHVHEILNKDHKNQFTAVSKI